MLYGYTLRDKNKTSDFYQYVNDSDGSYFAVDNHPTIQDEDSANYHLSLAKHDRDMRNKELEVVPVTYKIES